MNRPQSAPLPETLGIIVREYLKSLPERPRTRHEVSKARANRIKQAGFCKNPGRGDGLSEGDRACTS
jgi:hypothetical protein